MRIIYLLLIVLIISCKADSFISNDLNKRIFVYATEAFKGIDSTYTIDSVKALRTDTISDAELLTYKAGRIIFQIKNNHELIEIINEQYETHMRLANLTIGISTDESFDYLNDGMDDMKKLIELKKKDSIMIKQSDSLLTLAKISDSTKLRYYQLSCLVQYRQKNMSIKRDTILIFLTPSKEIIEPNDL